MRIGMFIYLLLKSVLEIFLYLISVSKNILLKDITKNNNKNHIFSEVATLIAFKKFWTFEM